MLRDWAVRALAAAGIVVVLAACTSEPEARSIFRPSRRTGSSMPPGGDQGGRPHGEIALERPVGVEDGRHLRDVHEQQHDRAVQAAGASVSRRLRRWLAWKLDPPKPLMDVSGTPFVSLETPSVVFFKGEYHMYYTGVHPSGQVPSMEIGHATSPDGITWTRIPCPSSGRAATSKEWTGYCVAEPGAIVFNDKIYVYFTGLGASPAARRRNCRTSALPHPRMARPSTRRALSFPSRSAIRRSRVPGLFDAVGAGGWTDGPPLLRHRPLPEKRQAEWRQVALQHAVSTDGGLTFVEDSGSLLRRDDAPWAKSGEVNGPAALIDGNDVKLWFGSHGSYDELGNMMKRNWKARNSASGW